ncbi:MAG: hypothetical protein AVDCRST_MAG26-4028 [uncultured Chloroflexia bacterium]|uniref:Uncharacterized protein n=1 Tax=uncultured Chloroflexia bacterium TaxID=1672391 RepID=A0A6J4JXW0_9CHLR|nr:MAG: hypothetical protein AVDCRST_MAG26-4028 [uncultured Chloroflexia bacterium]
MRPATLQIVSTSPGCISYRLIAAGRVVWSNRVHDRPEGHAGARRRLAAWAAEHRYTVSERKEGNTRRAS